MKHLAATIPLLAISLAAGCPVLAADALQLMRDSDRRIRSAGEIARNQMELYEGDKLVHIRTIVRMEKAFPSKRSTLVRFTGPAAVKNVSILIEDTGAAINDIWYYTPSTKNLRRIAGTQKQNWFMGTEFTYEDFEDYRLNAYSFKSIGHAEPCLIWSRCTMVDAVASNTDEQSSSGYSRKRYYIESGSLFPVQIEYFDRQGVLVKRMLTEGLRKCGEHPRATAQTMNNLVAGRKTRLILSDCTVDSGLDPNLFTQRALRGEP